MCKTNNFCLPGWIQAGCAESASNGWILLFSLAAWCWANTVLGDTNILRTWKTMENSDINEWWEVQCNRNMSQRESLCIHLFQHQWSSMLLDLATYTCWHALDLTMEKHKCELVLYKRPRSRRRRTLLALRLRRLKHFFHDERGTLIQFRITKPIQK